jgi:hypothetical protein
VQQCVAVHHHKERMQARRAHAQRLVAARALLAAGKLTRPAINRATPTLRACRVQQCGRRTCITKMSRCTHAVRMRSVLSQHTRTAACSTRATPKLHACSVQQCAAVHHTRSGCRHAVRIRSGL